MYWKYWNWPGVHRNLPQSAEGRVRHWYTANMGTVKPVQAGNGASSFLVTALIYFLVTVPAVGQSMANGQEPGFLRFIPGDGEFAGELQTAVTTYRNEAGVEVDLVATVHLAEQTYYDGLNAYFSTRDAVLYELVAEENVRPDGSGRRGGTGVIGFLQTSMTNLLDLSYQLDVINYARPNFVHADLEPDELDALMAAKGETLFSAFLALVLMELENLEQPGNAETDALLELSLTDILRLFARPDRQEAFRYLLARSLAASEGSLAAITGRGTTILDDRNGAALEVLSEVLQNPQLQRISIYYGAAHMTGLEQGLAELGFTRAGRNWLTAWTSG